MADVKGFRGPSRRGVLKGLGALGAAGALGRPAFAEAPPIRIGFIASLSGAFATNAQAIDFGFHCALDEINASGGLLGRHVEVITRDSAADPSKAVNFVKELLFNEKADVICGPTNSGEVLPTLGIVTSAKKLQIISGSVDELIDPKKYPMAFRCLNMASQWYSVAVKFNVDDLKARKVAIIADNSSFGALARQSIEKYLAKYGITPVYAVNADINKPDMTDDVLKAKNAGADCIQLWSNASGFLARVINARGEQNWNVPILAIPAVLQEQVANLLTKREYWGNVFSPGYSNSVLDAQGNLPPATQAFLTKYKDKVGPYMAAGIYAMLQGYNMPMIYAAGVKKAGSVDSAAVTKALESIPEIDLPYGPFHFTAEDHNGFPDSGMAMVAANSLQSNGGLKLAKAS
jgi:branched-chain amino acid transport system substrate-binding protein